MSTARAESNDTESLWSAAVVKKQPKDEAGEGNGIPAVA